MRSVGVDLAAEPAGTAVATLDWSGAGAVVTDLVLPADDPAVLAAVLAADKAGIDCPLGWPAPFVAFVTAHEQGHVPVPADLAGRDWRRVLALRGTDLAVHAATGLYPLSVAADRIGHTAMRCAGLLSALAAHGRPVDRTGAGVVVEVYPASSLRRWGLPHRGYKGTANAATRADLLARLRAAAPWLDLGRYAEVCARVDHALDAVLAALTARAVWLGAATAPDPVQAPAAGTEGWIALPTGALAELAGTASPA